MDNRVVRFEDEACETTVLALHKLCSNCSRVTKASQVLRQLSEGGYSSTPKVEKIHYGSAADLQTGYLDDCHLCAKLWHLASGHKLCIDATDRSKVEIWVNFKSRVSDPQPSFFTRMHDWFRSHPIPIARLHDDAIHFWLSATRDSIPVSLGVHHVNQSLCACRSSDLDAAHDIMTKSSVSVSSKHAMTMETIRSWYMNCVENHSKCATFPDLVSPEAQHPKRLLNVTGEQVHLQCDFPEADIGFTTLSHMWGLDPTQCPRLLTTNIEVYKSNIPLLSLPAKYIDAIRVTRALGYAHIWIDSLCIIQDSTEDWEIESLKMASIYGRTRCNITYVYPPSDAATKEHLRDPRLELPCRLPIHSKSKATGTEPGSENPYVIVKTCARVPSWSLRSQAQSWPVLKRAWVFQERLLCPRNIYYGTGSLFWECCEAAEDEFVGHVDVGREVGGKRVLYSVFSGIKNTADQGALRDSFHTQWLSLVNDYRMHDLTFEKDRSVAFAGIARAIEASSGFTYLAGIWKEFAIFDVLWHIETRRFNPDELAKFSKRKQTTIPAPSWSWLSTPCPGSGRGVTDVLTHIFCSELYKYRSYTLFKAEVISSSHPKLATHRTALLHDFKGSSITIRTRRIRCDLEWTKGDSAMPYMRVLPFGRPASGEVFVGNRFRKSEHAMTYYHDDIDCLPGSKLPADTFMILMVFQHAGTEGRKTNGPFGRNHFSYNGMKVDWQYGGLVVVRAEQSFQGRECWRRVGSFFFAGNVEDPDNVRWPFDLANRQNEDLILI